MNISEILAALRAPVPQELVSIKREEGTEVSYISWYNLVDLLNERANYLWEWEIEVRHHDDRTIVIGKLTIQGEDIALSRQSTGQEEHDAHNVFKPDGKRKRSFGDPTSNAEAMAFRRCCAKFGLGLDLYHKKGRGRNGGGNSRPTASPTQTPPRQQERRAVNAAASAIAKQYPGSEIRNVQPKETPAPVVEKVAAIDDPSKPWRKWKNPDDAIIWAQGELPKWDITYIQDCFENLPASENGKKGAAWVDWVSKRKGSYQPMGEEDIPY